MTIGDPTPQDPSPSVDVAAGLARARALLVELVASPLEDHPRQLEEVHRLLRDALAAAEGT
ncbi:MAG: hypothetical protein ACYDAQ_07300 [Mycobacteriales bacterium]